MMSLKNQAASTISFIIIFQYSHYFEIFCSLVSMRFTRSRNNGSFRPRTSSVARVNEIHFLFLAGGGRVYP